MKLLLFLIGHTLLTWDHDIHVSVSEIDIKEGKVEMVIKTYLDDLQKAIGLEPGTEVPEGYTSANELIGDYLGQTISLKLNDSKLNLSIDNITAAQDAVWITLTTTGSVATQAQHLILESTFLMEVYDDQTNVINIKWPTGKNSLLLKGKKTTETIALK